MIERLAARIGIVFLRIVGPAADYRMGVMTGVGDDLADRSEIDLLAQLEGEIDEGLRLVFRRIGLGIGFLDRVRPIPRISESYLILGVGAAQHPGDDGVLAFINRAWASLAAHRAIDRFDCELAGVSRHEGLPRADLALARLPR